MFCCNNRDKTKDNEFHYRKIEYFVNQYSPMQDDSLYFSSNRFIGIEKVESINTSFITKNTTIFEISIRTYITGQRDTIIKNMDDNKDIPYSVDDSLIYHLSMLDSSYLTNGKLKMQMGKLLEKKYLYIRNTSKNPEIFPIYNVSIWANRRQSNVLALKIINGKGGDFVCIDSLILKIDRIKDMQNDSIHNICKNLMNNNETGNCIW